MTRIVSAVPGRIRLRDKALRDAGRLEEVQARLASLEGVRSVEANVRTGSLLLRYDAERIDSDAMEALVQSAAQPGRNAASAVSVGSARRRAARQLNRYSKYGMLGSLAVSLVYAAAGKKRLHAATGGLFGAFLGVHMLVHRRHLLK